MKIIDVELKNLQFETEAELDSLIFLLGYDGKEHNLILMTGDERKFLVTTNEKYTDVLTTLIDWYDFRGSGWDSNVEYTLDVIGEL